MDDGIIEYPNDGAIEILKDYTGSLPLECSHLRKYLTALHLEQPLKHSPSAASSSSGSAVRSPLASAGWPIWLERWKSKRMYQFGQMLIEYNRRFLQSESVLISALETASAFDLGLPVSNISVIYDRRLMFERKGEAELGEVPDEFYIDSISPLVRLRVRSHYSSLISQRQATNSLDEAIETMFRSTELVTNDAKGRLVEGYILRCIRQLVKSKSESVTIRLLESGDWSKSSESIKFEFANASVVDFSGGGVPDDSMTGNLKNPIYFVPIRTNFPEFDFFYLKPGCDDLGQPSVLYRISITVNLTNHGYNPKVCNLKQWNPKLTGIPRLTQDYYTWMATKDQKAPTRAAGKTYLLDFNEMAASGAFPLLARLTLQ